MRNSKLNKVLSITNVISILLVYMLTSSSCCSGLRIKSIKVPAAVTNGSQVSLICLFDLERDQLYSVKWYQNYVEFYRFQPSSSSGDDATNYAKQDSPGQGFDDNTSSSLNDGDNYNTKYNNGSSSSSKSNEQDDKWASGSKQEFELDGINLNLQKSNATHVYLRQATLATDGMYKCEVSSDSPSFVTVSAERQMKVYALPKNRLTILEHSDRDQIRLPTNGQHNNIHRFTSNQNQNNNFHHLQQDLLLSKYQLNDLVNLTCVSSPSFPAAQLTWFVDEQPIIAPHPSNASNNTNNNIYNNNNNNNNGSIMRYFQLTSQSWSAAAQQQLQQRSNPASQQISKLPVPIESKLTLTFRLEPKLLNQLIKNQNDVGHELDSMSPNINRVASLQAKGPNLINLSCRAKMKIIYSSEASILLSGGPRNNVKQRDLEAKLTREGAHLGSLTPQPEPLSATEQSIANDFFHKQHFQSNNYKWPPSIGLLRVSNNNLLSLIDQLPSSELRLSNGNLQQLVLLIGQLTRQQQAPVLGNSLRLTKSEFVDQINQINGLLRRTQPNELENPLITQSQYEQKNSNENPDSDFNSNQTRNEQRLICQARLGDSPFEVDGNQIDNPAATLNFKWFMNKQELKSNEVNDFDKLRGFSFNPQMSTRNNSDQSNDSSSTTTHQSHRNGWKTRQMDLIAGGTSSIDPAEATPTTTTGNVGITRNDDFFDDTEPRSESSADEPESDLATKAATSQRGRQQQQHDKTSKTTFLVEMSPSLLQLKELEVSCQTQIEQTLIQYETRVAIALNLRQQDQKDDSNNNSRMSAPSSPIGQIPRGYQSPTSRIRNQQSNPSRLNRNKNSNQNRINNSKGNANANNKAERIATPKSVAMILQMTSIITLTTTIYTLRAYNVVGR